MDDVLKRLTALESSYSVIRGDLSVVAAVIPHLATRADLCEMTARFSALETAMIKWSIATLLSSGALAIGVVRLVDWLARH
jgi:hypothetical protein